MLVMMLWSPAVLMGCISTVCISVLCLRRAPHRSASFDLTVACSCIARARREDVAGDPVKGSRHGKKPAAKKRTSEDSREARSNLQTETLWSSFPPTSMLHVCFISSTCNVDVSIFIFSILIHLEERAVQWQ